MKSENITVVLVEPREAGNIGAAARAMSNMGLSRLVLVRPVDFQTSPAFRRALGGRDILQEAEVFTDLDEALAPFHFVVGTTRRGGGVRKGRLSPRALAPEVVGLCRENRVALLFGPEDRGLSNGELESCHRLMTIPSSPSNRSLNLAQAVLVVAYELFLVDNGRITDRLSPVPRKLAPLSILESMYSHMEKALLEIDYLHENNPKRMMRSFRTIFSRAGLDEREVRALRGVFHQILWYAGKEPHQGVPSGGSK